MPKRKRNWSEEDFIGATGCRWCGVIIANTEAMKQGHADTCSKMGKGKAKF